MVLAVVLLLGGARLGLPVTLGVGLDPSPVLPECDRRIRYKNSCDS